MTKIKTFNLLFCLFFGVGLVSCEAKSSKENKPQALLLAQKMASSEIARNPEGWTLDFNAKPKWEYTHGLMMSSMIQLWESTREEKYLDYVKHFTEFMVNQKGEILTYKLSDYNIDRVNGGKFLIDLFRITGEEKYKMATEMLRQQMREHPRNSEGRFWHKKVYPHQMWLDGLYMGSPFLAKYAAEFGESELFDDVFNQIFLMDKYGYSEETGLFHHAYDESKSQQWADPKTGLSTNYWGRSIGWFSMALVDVLDYFPEDHPDRGEIIAIVQKLAKGILKYQDATGVWYQVVDQSDREGNYLEASASSMFAYFLLKGGLKGYLSQEYLGAGKKAYEGVVNEFIREGDDGELHLTQVCAVAGLGGNPYRDGSYEYYIGEPRRDNDPKGVGPFIMASIWYDKLEK